VVGALGCDNYASVAGKVVNDRDDPVEGAHVKIMLSSEVLPIATATTSDKGNYRVSSTFSPSLRTQHLELVVERAGYKRYTEALSGAELEAHTVKLRRADTRVLEDERARERQRNISDEDLKLKLVWCPPGRFVIGEAEGQNELRSSLRRGEVTLTKGFWIGETEVTQGQWKRVMGTTPWRGRNDARDGDNYPVTWVDYEDAINFCTKLTARERRAKRLKADEEYRLPTEAQWEYAARGGKSSRFSFGDDASALGEYAWYRKNTVDVGEAFAHQVRQKKPNPWGLYDVHGNVDEWCRDAEGPESSIDRVFRGGSWYEDASGCRTASRAWGEPDFRWGAVGFRVARMSVDSMRAAANTPTR
jgi:formylglycine-generating enzyme required for sulfatase activity